MHGSIYQLATNFALGGFIHMEKSASDGARLIRNLAYLKQQYRFGNICYQVDLVYLFTSLNINLISFRNI